MKTDSIKIRSDLTGREEALAEAERFVAYCGITGKYAMHLRLLTEETISMVHGILSNFEGDFWIESEKCSGGRYCRICVAADIAVSESQEAELMQMSSSGKNEEAKGFLGVIREIFRWSVQRTSENPQNIGTAADIMYNMGIDAAMGKDAFWSLQQYRASLKQHVQEEQGRQAWDELEKSIVANLSDEIKIGITEERATVIIERFFPDTPKN